MHTVGQADHKIGIADGWRVLDVGSGHNPYARANVLVDREIGTSVHRSGKAIRLDGPNDFIIADACSLPFKDKVFDYVVASHIAEHVEQPDELCQELARVGKRGYIETPSGYCEHLLGEPCHSWFVYRKNAALEFEKKLRPTGSRWFYLIFYYGRERAGHPRLGVSNRIIHTLLKLASRVVLRLWRLEVVRARMYTCLEWEESVPVRVRHRR